MNSKSKAISDFQYKYLQQDSDQTLKQGMEEYFSTIPGLLTDADMSSKEVADMYRGHDAMHVVFGCDTSISGEFRVDAWTLFGSTMTLKEGIAYNKVAEAQSTFKEIGYAKLALGAILSLPLVFRVMFRAFSMKRKWPWREWKSFEHTPLQKIRSQFQISVV